MEVTIEQPTREVESDRFYIKHEHLPEKILRITGIDTRQDRLVARMMLKAAMAVFEEYREGAA